MTYKEVADAVTKANLDEILNEVESEKNRRSGSERSRPDVIKGRNGTINEDGALNQK